VKRPVPRSAKEEISITTVMETTTITNRKRASRKRKLTPEENRALNAAMPAGNKYTEAARKHQGSFIVYDPHFML